MATKGTEHARRGNVWRRLVALRAAERLAIGPISKWEGKGTDPGVIGIEADLRAGSDWGYDIRSGLTNICGVPGQTGLVDQRPAIRTKKAASAIGKLTW